MKYLRTYPFGLLTLAAITILSLMPAQEFPEVDVQFADKWTHWIMYGFLTMVMGIEAIRQRNKAASRANGHAARPHDPTGRFSCPCLRSFLDIRFLAIMFFASSWGAFMELCQAYLTTTRSGDWLDAMANAFGALCAFVILTVHQRCTAGK